MVALLLGAVSCNNDVAPRGPLEVAIAATASSAPNIWTSADSGQRIECAINLSAKASGTDSATWSGGTIRFYEGTNRSVPLDSLAVSASDVQSKWGSAHIAGGQTQTSQWNLQAGAPFSVEIELPYQPAHSGADTAKASFDCGPKPAADARPPSSNSITVRTGSDSLQPGDELTIDYTITSTVGLWQTAVQLSGACPVYLTTHQAGLQTVLRSSVAIKLSAACQLGNNVVVTVFATDAGLETGSKALSTLYRLVDTRPPALRATVLPAPSPQPPVIFAGDSVGMHVTATDNHALGGVVFDLAPDSVGLGLLYTIVATDSIDDQDVFIDPLPGTAGPMQLQVYARDAVGHQSEVLTDGLAGLPDGAVAFGRGRGRGRDR